MGRGALPGESVSPVGDLGRFDVEDQLVARVARTTVDQFADQHLFEPVDVHNYTFPHYHTGITLCHGDIYIPPPRGMAKFGQLYMNGGTRKGQQVLSKEWINKSVAPSVSVRNFHLGWAQECGYLWWLNNYMVGGTSYRTFKALGWGGQEVWVVPDEQLVVVFTGANYTVNPPCDELMTRFILPTLSGAAPFPGKLSSPDEAEPALQDEVAQEGSIDEAELKENRLR